MIRPEPLFRHLFGKDKGFLVTFSGQQTRLRRPSARHNELTGIRQRSWRYPDEAQQAGDYLVDEAQLERDTYIGVHLFREPGNRLASNAAATVRSLWLDEDGGTYPEIGPEPTATVRSSAERRHLYWRLSRPVTVEWAVSINRRLAVWAGGDAGKAGAASVLRATGTANYKRCPRVDLVVGQPTGAGPWEPEVMEEAIPPLREPEPKVRRAAGAYDGPEVDLEPYLARVEVLGEAADGRGHKLAIVCPWIQEHSGGDRTGTYVGQRTDGGLWFYCNHEHCQGRGWPEFRMAVRGQVVRITRHAGRPNDAKAPPERTVKITRE
ncbi:MAG TPA: hypothetical protein VFH16_05670 [Rubrobacter sp.]|jgi:RepB DNA-primase from phage plasmid|nr:hypothetical protein [Rubrobacter sp.]